MDSKTIVLNVMRSQGATDAAALAKKSVNGNADGTALIAAEEQIPTWRQRDFTGVPIGTPYNTKIRCTSCGRCMTQQISQTGFRIKRSVFGTSVIRRIQQQQKNM